MPIIIIETTVKASMEKCWECWTNPAHITKWNNASDDWHTPFAENDLRNGGEFSYRMEAKNGSFGFDFGGVYDEIKKYSFISYTIGDGRKVEITFIASDDGIKITESFEAENTSSIDLQRQGWQSILDNFKRYVEQIEA